MDQEEKLNWEKLLKHLEGDQEAAQNSEELNPEELEMLLLAEETNMRLNGINPEEQFPVEKGWVEIQEKYELQNTQKTIPWRKHYSSILAVAAMFITLLGTIWWFQRAQNHVITAVPEASTEVSLTLGNGKTIALAQQVVSILKSEGAELNGSSLVYKKEAEIAVTEQLSMNILEVPYGKQSRLELSDGTVVWINAGSKLTYPTRFMPSKRELTLEGEAFFEVSHDAKRPFTVHVKGVDVRVLGTAFNVSTFGTMVKTALVRGKVSLAAGTQSAVLEPGELGFYDIQKAELSKSESDLKPYTAWKDGEVYFTNSTLEEIAFRLKREYNLQFQFEDAELAKLHFTVDMPKTANVQAILANIKMSTNQIDFVYKGNLVQVKRR